MRRQEKGDKDFLNSLALMQSLSKHKEKKAGSAEPGLWSEV